MNPTQKPDRPWREYPIGTRAFAINGGHWTKTPRGWKWCTGATFPTPGGDAYRMQLPDEGTIQNGVVSRQVECTGCGTEFEDLHLVGETPDDMPWCDGCISTMEP